MDDSHKRIGVQGGGVAFAQIHRQTPFLFRNLVESKDALLYPCALSRAAAMAVYAQDIYLFPQTCDYHF